MSVEANSTEHAAKLKLFEQCIQSLEDEISNLERGAYDDRLDYVGSYAIKDEFSTLLPFLPPLPRNYLDMPSDSDGDVSSLQNNGQKHLSNASFGTKLPPSHTNDSHSNNRPLMVSNSQGTVPYFTNTSIHQQQFQQQPPQHQASNMYLGPSRAQNTQTPQNTPPLAQHLLTQTQSAVSATQPGGGMRPTFHMPSAQQLFSKAGSGTNYNQSKGHHQHMPQQQQQQPQQQQLQLTPQQQHQQQKPMWQPPDGAGSSLTHALRSSSHSSNTNAAASISQTNSATNNLSGLPQTTPPPLDQHAQAGNHLATSIPPGQTSTQQQYFQVAATVHTVPAAELAQTDHSLQQSSISSSISENAVSTSNQPAEIDSPRSLMDPNAVASASENSNEEHITASTMRENTSKATLIAELTTQLTSPSLEAATSGSELALEKDKHKIAAPPTCVSTRKVRASDTSDDKSLAASPSEATHASASASPAAHTDATPPSTIAPPPLKGPIGRPRRSTPGADAVPSQRTQAALESADPTSSNKKNNSSQPVVNSIVARSTSTSLAVTPAIHSNIAHVSGSISSNHKRKQDAISPSTTFSSDSQDTQADGTVRRSKRLST